MEITYLYIIKIILITYLDMRKAVFMALFAFAAFANAQTAAVSDSIRTTKNDTVAVATTPTSEKADPIAALTKKAG